MESTAVMGLAGCGVIVLLWVILAVKVFPSECGEFFRRLGAPSDAEVRKRSDKMLADMDRNVAERKVKHQR